MNNNIRLDMNSDKKPIFSTRRQIFYREEHNGYASIVPRGQNVFSPLLINPTTVYILSLMNGKNSINDIYRIMIKKYGEENRTTIETDLTRILYDLFRNKIILWGKGGSPYMDRFEKTLDCGYTIRLAFDNDLRKIVKFINASSVDDAIISYCNPLLKIEKQSELIIRSSLFTMMSCIFMLEYNGQIVGLYSFDESPTTNTAVISNIISPVEYINLMIKESSSLITKAAVCVPKKLRLYLTNNTNTSAKIRNEIIDSLFSSIAILYNEVDEMDIEMLDYEIKETLCK